MLERSDWDAGCRRGIAWAVERLREIARRGGSLAVECAAQAIEVEACLIGPLDRPRPVGRQRGAQAVAEEDADAEAG